MGLPEAIAEPEASAAANGGTSVAAVSREILRFQRAALSREVRGSARYSPELHLGEDSAANGRVGEATQEARLTSQTSAAQSAARDDAAYRRQRSRLVSG